MQGWEPHQSDDPSPTIPTNRMKEEKRKTGDRKGASSETNKKVLALALETHQSYTIEYRSARSFQSDTDRKIKIIWYCEVLQHGDT